VNDLSAFRALAQQLFNIAGIITELISPLYKNSTQQYQYYPIKPSNNILIEKRNVRD
jgi:hypothetical protein